MTDLIIYLQVQFIALETFKPYLLVVVKMELIIVHGRSSKAVIDRKKVSGMN